MASIIKVYHKGLDKGPRVFFHGADGLYAPIILTRVEFEQLDKPEKLEVAIRKAN
jgi:hypothetical protein